MHVAYEIGLARGEGIRREEAQSSSEDLRFPKIDAAPQDVVGLEVTSRAVILPVH